MCNVQLNNNNYSPTNSNVLPTITIVLITSKQSIILGISISMVNRTIITTKISTYVFLNVTPSPPTTSKAQFPCSLSFSFFSFEGKFFNNNTIILKRKHVNRNSHAASSPISQSSFFEGVCSLILASSQIKPRAWRQNLKKLMSR